MKSEYIHSSDLRHIIFNFLYFVSAHSPHNSHKSCFLFLRIYTQTPRYKNQPLFAAEHAVACSPKTKTISEILQKRLIVHAHSDNASTAYVRLILIFVRSPFEIEFDAIEYYMHMHRLVRACVSSTQSQWTSYENKNTLERVLACVCMVYAYNTTHWLPHRVCMSVHTVRDILLACNHLSTTLSYGFR